MSDFCYQSVVRKTRYKLSRGMRFSRLNTDTSQHDSDGKEIGMNSQEFDGRNEDRSVLLYK